MPPAINYERMQRIRLAGEDPPNLFMNKTTKFCILIMFVGVCILYKRWVDKKQRINPPVSY